PASPDRPVFHRHAPDAAVARGDEVVLLGVESAAEPRPARRARARGSAIGYWRRLRASLRRPAGVVVASLIALVLALSLPAIAFPSSEGDLSRVDGIFSALVLMTGGTYADLFPPFHHLANRMRMLSIALSAIGTIFVGLLYAWLTERLMTLRLRLGPRRPP